MFWDPSIGFHAAPSIQGLAQHIWCCVQRVGVPRDHCHGGGFTPLATCRETWTIVSPALMWNSQIYKLILFSELH